MPLNKLLERLRAGPEAAPTGLPFPRGELAVAVLLLEAAQVDGDTREEERAAVQRLVRGYFRLPPAESAQLMQIAEGEFAAALDDWVFTHTVRQSFSEIERQAILEMLWQVVYTDGELARFEDALMGRVARALDLTPQVADGARERAFARVTLGDRGSQAQ